MPELQYEYTPATGPRRRVTVETAPSTGPTRHVEEWTGCRWRTVGREPVADVVVDSE